MYSFLCVLGDANKFLFVVCVREVNMGNMNKQIHCFQSKYCGVLIVGMFFNKTTYIVSLKISNFYNYFKYLFLKLSKCTHFCHNSYRWPVTIHLLANLEMTFSWICYLSLLTSLLSILKGIITYIENFCAITINF